MIPVLPGIRTLNADGFLAFSAAVDGLATAGSATTTKGAAGFTELGGATFLEVAGSSSFKCG